MKRVPGNLSLLSAVLAGWPLLAVGGPDPASPPAILDPAQGGLSTTLRARKAQFGLGPQDDLRVVRAHAGEGGILVARSQQMHQGYPVWGGALVSRHAPGGGVEVSARNLYADVALSSTRTLPVDKLVQIGRARAGLTLVAEPKCELVVFPSALQDRLKVRRDPATGAWSIDPVRSVAATPRSEPYVMAAHLVFVGVDTARGLDAEHLILDAVTGEVLKRWSEVHHLAAEGTPAVSEVAVSQYNGTVRLSTTRDADGTYQLKDLTRVSDGIGLVTHAWNQMDPTLEGTLPYRRADNTWGDGMAFIPSAGFSDPLSRTGETAAVDATFAVQRTWDFYRQVFGWNGVDGTGKSVKSIVHFSPLPWPWFNAAWIGDYDVMVYGDGAPQGPLTTLDVGAHELSHGVMQYTAGLRGGEASGLNEANSDIFATAVKLYAWGESQGQGTTVPSEAPGMDWTIGNQLFGEPGTALRAMFKPSLDGYSYDAWFDGIGAMDSHFAMGPANRMFYFLCRGASADVASARYSPYLPEGMTGIGADKAIRIWWRAITQHLADRSSGYRQLRPALLAAAAELFGEGSKEQDAARNAFAAVGVGAKAGGKEPVLVLIEENEVAPVLVGDPHLHVVAAREPSALPAVRVSNAVNSTVTWSLGGFGQGYPTWGRVMDNRRFQANDYSYNLSTLQAKSTEDPLRAAATFVYSTPMDVDADTEMDALDMGAIALGWGIPQDSSYAQFPGANLYIKPGMIPDDIDCQLFIQGFSNAFVREVK